jgi:hypothetical protein
VTSVFARHLDCIAFNIGTIKEVNLVEIIIDLNQELCFINGGVLID